MENEEYRDLHILISSLISKRRSTKRALLLMPSGKNASKGRGLFLMHSGNGWTIRRLSRDQGLIKLLPISETASPISKFTWKMVDAVFPTIRQRDPAKPLSQEEKRGCSATQ